MNVIGHDNRGTVDVPFGFVYFDDNSRVIYASNAGIHTCQGPYWKSSTHMHVNKAKAYLARKFPSAYFGEMGTPLITNRDES